MWKEAIVAKLTSLSQRFSAANEEDHTDLCLTPGLHTKILTPELQAIE
jgi:hypothetical protein